MAGATLRHLAAAAVKGSRHDLSAGMLPRKNHSVAAATQIKGSRAGVYSAGKLQLTPILRGGMMGPRAVGDIRRRTAGGRLALRVSDRQLSSS